MAINIKRVSFVVLVTVVFLGAGWLVLVLTSKQPPVGPGGNANVNQPYGFPFGQNGNVNVGVIGGVNLPLGNVNANANVNLPPGVTPPTGTISPVAAGGATSAPTLTQGTIVGASTAGGNGVRFYDPSDGKFYQMQADGTRQALADVSYPSVQHVTWSPSGTDAILEFPDGAKVVYDFTQKKQFSLPRQMQEFSFSPDGGKIAGKFIGQTAADTWITTVNPDGSGLTGVEPMGDNADKVDIAWAPNNQVVALSRTGDAQGLFQQQVLLVGFHGENFSALNVNGRGFTYQWTPDGNRLLYSVYSDQTNYRPALYLVDAATDRVGANQQALNLATWADKCTMAGKVAYCAVPQNLPDGAAFSRDLVSSNPDFIYQVNLSTGSSTLLAQPVGVDGTALTANNLTVSSDGRTLYFTDNAGQLHEVRLLP